MPPALRTTSRSQYAPVFLENEIITSREPGRNLIEPRLASHRAKNRLRRARACRTTSSMPELKDFASSVAIVVSSCDAFFDAWRPFAFFFRKHWSDCPFPVFLIVNRLRVRSNFLQPITVGPDRDWAANMDVALKQITQPYVLYLQEDYFLEWSGEPGAVGRRFRLRLRPRRRFFLLLRPVTAGARFRAAKRSLRDCAQGIRRAHPAPGDPVEKRCPPIRPATG